MTHGAITIMFMMNTLQSTCLFWDQDQMVFRYFLIFIYWLFFIARITKAAEELAYLADVLEGECINVSTFKDLDPGIYFLSTCNIKY